jgi:hypothetical protein
MIREARSVGGPKWSQLFAGLSFVLLGYLNMWSAISSGYFVYKSGSEYSIEDPLSFWFGISFYSLMVLGFSFAVSFTVIDIARNMRKKNIVTKISSPSEGEEIEPYIAEDGVPLYTYRPPN